MITKSNLKNMLKSAGFSDTSKDKYEKNYPLWKQNFWSYWNQYSYSILAKIQ